MVRSPIEMVSRNMPIFLPMAPGYGAENRLKFAHGLRKK